MFSKATPYFIWFIAAFIVFRLTSAYIKERNKIETKSALRINWFFTAMPLLGFIVLILLEGLVITIPNWIGGPILLFLGLLAAYHTGVHLKFGRRWRLLYSIMQLGFFAGIFAIATANMFMYWLARGEIPKNIHP